MGIIAKYNQQTKKQRELTKFVENFYLTKVVVYDDYVVYKIGGNKLLETIQDAKAVIGDLKLDLDASQTGRSTFVVK